MNPAMTDTATPTHDDGLYTADFFKVAAAVVLFMSGVALQFHFGQYFEYLGHDVGTLGLITGLSVTGTLAIRLHLGRWIDRVGCRTTWLVGSVTVAFAAAAMQFTASLPLIVLLRALWGMAIATVMTTVAVFAAQVAPPGRRTESIGSIGLAGFAGMFIGPTLGDFIFAGDTSSIVPYRVFFCVTAACSLGSGAIIWAMRSLPGCAGNKKADAATHTEPVLRIVARHWPGTILLVGVAFAMCFSVQQMFLERLAEDAGFKNIKVFFLTYAPTAIILRLIFRRLPERLGRTRTLVGGLIFMAVGIALLVGIQTQYQLIAPALFMGTGHCFIFPSMVDLAAERLPTHQRGMGTSIILGAGDLGLLISYVLLGQVIDAYGFDAGLKLLSAVVLASAIVFAIARRKALIRRPNPGPKI